MRNSILFLLALFLSFNAQSQIQFHGGLGGNINLSVIHNNLKGTKDYAMLGGTLQFRTLMPFKKISLILDTQLELINWREKYNFQGELSNKNEISYLSLLPQVGFRPIKPIGVSVGGFTSLKIRERYYDYSGNSGNWQSPLHDSYTDFDAGLIAGLDYYIKRFSVSLSYRHGMLNVSEEIQFTDENGNLIGNPKSAYNRIIQLIGRVKI